MCSFRWLSATQMETSNRLDQRSTALLIRLRTDNLDRWMIPSFRDLRCRAKATICRSGFCQSRRRRRFPSCQQLIEAFASFRFDADGSTKGQGRKAPSSVYGLTDTMRSTPDQQNTGLIKSSLRIVSKAFIRQAMQSGVHELRQSLRNHERLISYSRQGYFRTRLGAS